MDRKLHIVSNNPDERNPGEKSSAPSGKYFPVGTEGWKIVFLFVRVRCVFYSAKLKESPKNRELNQHHILVVLRLQTLKPFV